MGNEELNSKELKEDDKFSTELKKLKKIFKNIPKDKKNLVNKLIESAAFMSVELKKLELYISENGVTEEYQNGSNQWGTKVSTEASVYNTMIKNYTSIIKQLCELFDQLHKKGKIDEESYILFVNDGSKDQTWNLISKFNEQEKWVSGLNLAANVGHQNALYAGLMTAYKNVDATISIDADLQDDINVIENMIDEFNKGNDIVYGVRNDRTSDSFFKRFTAQSFYKLMTVMGVKSVYNHADFRLMSARAVEQLGNYKERNLFLRGIVPLIGYNTSCVYYARKERMAGESKYPLKKMLSFAFDGITSFSIKPITMISWVGFLAIVFSVCAMIYTFIGHFVGNTVSGWSSLMISIWFLGGVQLLSIGVIGQYIGKTYVEVKERPRYNIDVLLESKSVGKEND